MSDTRYTLGFVANDDTEPVQSPSSQNPLLSPPEFTCICPYCQRRFDMMEQFTLHIVTRHTWKGSSKPEGPIAVGK